MDEVSRPGMARDVAVVIAVGLALRAAFLLWGGGMLVDDAYITIRCAEHLAAGHGLVFNVGERVLCVSTPLYAVLLAPLVRALSPAAVGYAIGAVSTALFALAAWWLALLLAGAGRWVRLLALVLFSAYLPFADNSTVGMETPIFLLGVVGSLHLLRARRLGWLSLVLGLLVLVRPEGALWGFAVLLTMRVSRIRLEPRALIPGLAVLLAWLTVSVAYYGSPIPHSVVAKSGFAGAQRFGLSARVAWTTVRSLALVKLPADWGLGARGSWLLEGAGATVALVLFAIGAWRLVRKRSPLLPFALLFVFYVAFYLLARGRTEFSWYGVPSGLAFWVVVSVGIGVVARRVVPARLVRAAAGASLAAVTVLLAAAGAVAWRAERLPSYRAIAESYRPAGEYVADHSAPDAVVFVDELGMVGWRAGRTVHDLAGITSPSILEVLRREGSRRGAATVLKSLRPDFVVLGVVDRARLAESSDGWLDEHYEVTAEFPFHAVLEPRPERPGP